MRRQPLGILPYGGEKGPFRRPCLSGCRRRRGRRDEFPCGTRYAAGRVALHFLPVAVCDIRVRTPPQAARTFHTYRRCGRRARLCRIADVADVLRGFLRRKLRRMDDTLLYLYGVGERHIRLPDGGTVRKT